MIAPATPKRRGSLIEAIQGAEEARPAVGEMFQIAGGEKKAQALGFYVMKPGSEGFTQLPG